MREAILLAALFLQEDPIRAILERAEEAGRSPSDITATVTAETEDKVDESRSLATGRLVLRARQAGERALWVELKESRPGARPARTLIRRQEAVVLKPGERAGRVIDLSAAGNFHPFELWRRGLGRWLRERFEIARAGVPGEEDLPPAVSGPEGVAVAARRARPQARRKVYDRASPEGPAPGPGHFILDLVPRDAGLRERLVSLRVYVEPDSCRVVQLVEDLPARRVTYTLGDIREVQALEDPVFEMEIRGTGGDRR